MATFIGGKMFRTSGIPGGVGTNAKGNRITNVGTPTLSSDAATKNYVDTEIEKVTVGDWTPPEMSDYVKQDEATLSLDQSTNVLTLNAKDRQSSVQLPTGQGFDVATKNAMLAFCKAVAAANTSTKDAAAAMRATIVNMEEFAKMGTGLFIHWGVYSVPAGRYTGEKQPGGTTNTNIVYNCEWSMRDLAIPRAIYKEFEKEFNTTNFDADALIAKAKDAGMGYVILTVKHHEGFSLYPTSYGNWDVRTAGKEGAPCRRTIVQELKTACEKYGLKFGLYFSQYWDWMAEGGFGMTHNGKWNGTTTDEFTDTQHIEYCKKSVLQLEEIFEQFHPYILWWDPGGNVADKYVAYFRDCLDTTLATCIHNDRVQYNRGYGGDYGTGERTIYLKNALKYGEACFTMNSTWGYSINNEKDSYYYGAEKIFKQFIIYSLAHGQNCLMNVGPKNDGSIPSRQIDFLNVMKNFANKYGSFKNYQRVNYNAMPKWGYMLQFPNNTIVCYIFMPNNAGYQQVELDCVPTNNLESVDILTPGTNPTYVIGTNRVTVSGLALDADTKIGVVRLNYSMAPMCEDANLMRINDVLPSRAFLMTNANQTYDFTNLMFNLTPSRHIEHKSDIIWDGATENYNVSLSFTCPDDGDETATLVVLDVTDGTTTTTLTFQHGQTISTNTVNLVNGHRYRLTFSVSGTDTGAVFKWNGLSFTTQNVSVTGITLNQSSIELDYNGSMTLFADITPANASNQSVIWTVGNSQVATVTNGLVTAVSAGNTTITATTVDGGFSATCSVRVKDAPGVNVVHVTGVTMVPKTLTMYVGVDQTLQYTIAPADATTTAVTWETSNPDIVTVVDGRLECHAEGTATITVRTVDGGFTDTCAITAQVVHVDSVTLDKSTYSSIPGYGTKLNATVMPSTAYNQALTWSTGNADVATVDSQGNVTPQGPGTTTITASSVDGNKTASCTINVTAETYDYIWQHASLAGTEGEDATINGVPVELFSDDMTNWTLFSYAQNSKNPNTDKNATLFQCVVNSSPWTGIRVDADNNAVANTSSNPAPLRPRFVAGCDAYWNCETGVLVGTSIHESATTPKHPFGFSRDGDNYYFSFDGVTWTKLDSNTPYGLASDQTFGSNVDQSQINRLKNCNAKLTVGMDYTRSGGNITTTKYRWLKSDYPACVALKLQSNYRFHTLYKTYDAAQAASDE